MLRVIGTVAPVPVVEVFADVVCAFTHFGLRHLATQRDQRGLDVQFRVRAWPLEWVNGHAADPAATARQVDALRAQLAPQMFSGFDASTFPTTSVPAFGLASAAYEHDIDRGEQVSLAIRDALFESGRDISDERVLADIAATFGVDPPSAAGAEDATRRDWEAGRARGVVGSPHFFTPDGEGFFCPSLEISRGEGGPVVEYRAEMVDALLAGLCG